METVKISYVGTISAGKTTLLNALCKKKLGETHIIKTTILPHIYIETDTEHHTSEYIKSHTDEKNNQFYDNKDDSIEEVKYNISKLTDFVSFNKNIKLKLYDIPGLNDSETKERYYNYLTKVIKNINIIVWTIDVNSAINTTDELDICNLLIENIKNNNNNHTINTKLVVLLNKCDNMYISDGEFILDKDIQEMYNQAKRMIDTSIQKIYPECKYDIIPISSENSYIYRMIQKEDINILEEKYLNKLGYREFARKDWNRMTTEQKINNLKQKLDEKTVNYELENTGFNRFRQILQGYFNDTGEYLFLLDSVKSKMLNDLDTIIKASNFDIKSNSFVDMDITVFIEHKRYIDTLLSEVKLDDIHIENVMNVFNKCIIAILQNSDSLIYNVIENRKNVDSVEVYKTLKIFYDVMLTFVDNDIVKNMSCYNKVLKIITDDTIEKIHAIKDIDTQFEYIKHLVEFGYDKWIDILKACFVEKALADMDTRLFIETIKKCYTVLNLEADVLLDISFTIMDIKYSRFFANDDVATVLSCAKYWDDIIIRSSNSYSYPIFGMRQLLNRYIGMNFISIDNYNDDYTFMLEKFILGLFQKVYPDAIITKDSLF